MPIQARYAHTNLVAHDWKRLADFYTEAFGCEPMPPERKLSGEWLARGTGVPGARLQGIHLRLPGHGDKGPTLEIFQYHEARERLEPAANRPGFGHIAFVVDDVEAAQEKVMAAGGGALGEIASAEVEGAGLVTFTYVTDPEGNIVELQHWS
jgi:predicted enzyme related to lactoylglutathione lyase